MSTHRTKTPRGVPQQTAGFRDQSVGYFADVDRALSAYLRKTDEAYRKRSDEAQKRSIESHERKRREREGKFEMKLSQ